MLIVMALLGYGFWHVYGQAIPAVFSTATPTSGVTPASSPTENTASPSNGSAAGSVANSAAGSAAGSAAIVRQVWLKTDITSQTTYKVGEYTVKSGDALFNIAKQNNIKPETLLWANSSVLKDDPHSLRVGQVLNVPPVDGVYYQVQQDDTLESIAEKFDASLEDILNWPGNNIDLTNAQVTPGEYVMVPGGYREFVQWVIPTVARGQSGTSNVGGTVCSGGPVGGGGFIWPSANHFLSGNDYWDGHLAIDIATGAGDPVWAADAGVVTVAGWRDGGYGNVVMIDHGNGYITVYAHLSQVNVTVCQGVSAGTTIGLAGSTGNSTGAHLHFEVRQNGGFINPWYVLP